MAHNHGSHQGHNHSHGGDGNIGLAFFLNLSFTFIELIGGILTNSIAIMSDAVHDFGDSLSLALAWYFQKKSKKGSTNQYTYGYKRFSLLGAIITSTVLTVGSIYILTEAIPRLFSPQETNAGGMFILAVIGIAINGIAVLRTRKASSINERVVSLHLLEDVLGWAGVLIGSAVIYFTGLTIIDPILSIGIAIFVLFNVTKNIRQIMPILLQGTPAEIEQEHIIEDLKALEQIEDVHDLHIWSLDEEYNVLTMHVVLKTSMSMEELSQLKGEIRAILKEEEIRHATIEFEGPSESCDFDNCV
ncbi:cation diffusion facilitator family transporter [Clostridium sp. Marseille-P299]|uniref:cation diffusion facilitator family transporter n=1 Tax=Clostridium sp. Marseille-P299 TaxID=1805477 RepID=UPI00082AC00F|nr:cation diffusion facilitator family transporter [Clostridium sp. Marseille-P299]